MNNDLYYVIKNQCSDIPLTIENKRDCIKNISKLDNEGHHGIYYLINNFNRENGLDYQGKTVKSNDRMIDVKFNLETLPNLLQQIIYKFSTMHLNNIEEESKRNEYCKF